MASVDIQALKDRIDYRSYYEQHVRFTTRGNEWWEGHCPFHEDKSPSFGANIKDGRWKCHSCGQGGDVLEFEQRIHNCDFKQAIQNLGGGNVIPFRPASGSRPAPARAEDKKEAKTIDPAVAERYHQLLLTDERAKGARQFLRETRGYTEETIAKFKLGFEPTFWKDQKARITFPVYDEAGQLVNIRMYRRLTDEEVEKKDGNAKMLPWKPQGYGSVRWYPIGALRGDEIVICEGEPDTLLCRQLGFNAVTQTGGAGTFLARWAPLFAGKRVRVCYDHDTAGHEGALKVAEAIASTAQEVKIIELPVLGNHEDLTDWVLKYDGNPEGFRELIESAPVFRLPEGSQADTPAADAIPLEQQIRELPKDLDWEEKQAAFRRWVTEVAKKRPAEQDRLIDLMAVALNMKKTTLRREVKAAEATLKLEPPIPTPLTEPRQDDVVLAQDYHKGVFHYGVWLPTNKGEYVFRLVTSEKTLIEVEKKDLPRDTRRWSVDARTPNNVFAYLAGQTHVDPSGLFDQLEGWFRRYLWYPDDRIYPLLAAWTMQTYTFILYDQTGYLALVGTRGAGKSLLFEVLKELCFNALHTAVPSDAYVFRSVDADRVTLLIDEADAMKSAPKEPVNSQLEILRSGYRRSGTVGRVEGEERKRVEFCVYSPKAIANVSGLEDALEDRTIPIPVVRKPAQVSMQQHILRQLQEDYQLLRNQLYCYGLEYAGRLAEIYDQVNIRGRIRDREADIWSGLVAVIRLVKPEIESKLLDLAAENSQRKNLHEGSESVEGQEVMVLWEIACNEEPTVVEARKRWYSSTRICEAVKDQLGWESFSPTRLANDLVKMKIVDDSSDYKKRFPIKTEHTDKNGNVKTRKHKPICYWLRKDRIISAAERYSVPLDGITGPSEQKKTPETEEDSPFC